MSVYFLCHLFVHSDLDLVAYSNSRLTKWTEQSGLTPLPNCFFLFTCLSANSFSCHHSDISVRVDCSCLCMAACVRLLVCATFWELLLCLADCGLKCLSIDPQHRFLLSGTPLLPGEQLGWTISPSLAPSTCFYAFHLPYQERTDEGVNLCVHITVWGVCFSNCGESSVDTVRLPSHSRQPALTGRCRQSVITLCTAVRDSLMEGIKQQHHEASSLRHICLPLICQHVSVLFSNVLIMFFIVSVHWAEETHSPACACSDHLILSLLPFRKLCSRRGRRMIHVNILTFTMTKVGQNNSST